MTRVVARVARARARRHLRRHLFPERLSPHRAARRPERIERIRPRAPSPRQPRAHALDHASRLASVRLRASRQRVPQRPPRRRSRLVARLVRAHRRRERHRRPRRLVSRRRASVARHVDDESNRVQSRNRATDSIRRVRVRARVRVRVRVRVRASHARRDRAIASVPARASRASPRRARVATPTARMKRRHSRDTTTRNVTTALFVHTPRYFPSRERSKQGLLARGASTTRTRNA